MVSQITIWLKNFIRALDFQWLITLWLWGVPQSTSQHTVSQWPRHCFFFYVLIMQQLNKQRVFRWWTLHKVHRVAEGQVFIFHNLQKPPPLDPSLRKIIEMHWKIFSFIKICCSTDINEWLNQHKLLTDLV